MTLPISWFDLAVFLFVCIGLVRGRKRGMSMELLPLFQVLLIVAAGSYVYEPLGDQLAEASYLSPLFSYVLVYIAFAIFVMLLFSRLKELVGDKLVGSDVFGRFEFYLGMPAGAVRFAAYTIIFLAVLNAKSFSPEQLEAQRKKQQELFGDISFPTIGSIQEEIFHNSYTGKFVRQHLDDLLIAPASARSKSLGEQGPARKRERTIEDVIGSS